MQQCNVVYLRSFASCCVRSYTPGEIYGVQITLIKKTASFPFLHCLYFQHVFRLRPITSQDPIYTGGIGEAKRGGMRRGVGRGRNRVTVPLELGWVV